MFYTIHKRWEVGKVEEPYLGTTMVTTKDDDVVCRHCRRYTPLTEGLSSVKLKRDEAAAQGANSKPRQLGIRREE